MFPLQGSGARLGYTLMMALLYMTFPGIYSIVAAAVNEAFGPEHYKVGNPSQTSSLLSILYYYFSRLTLVYCSPSLSPTAV